MRVTLLTLAIMVAMSTDAQVLLWVVALLPAAGALMFLGFMLKPAARKRPQSDTKAWRGTHRQPPTRGRHSPARGKRLAGVSRQAQLEERTVSVNVASLGLDREAHVHDPYRDGVRIRCRTCSLDLDQPAGMPDIGPNGFSSWA